jgi:hypothetical protein
MTLKINNLAIAGSYHVDPIDNGVVHGAGEFQHGVIALNDLAQISKVAKKYPLRSRQVSKALVSALLRRMYNRGPEHTVFRQQRVQAIAAARGHHVMPIVEYLLH